MLQRINLLLLVFTMLIVSNLTMAQFNNSCTYAGIAQGKIQEAQKQLAELEQTLTLIERTRTVSDKQEALLLKALEEYADARQVAYETSLKSAEYAARTEGAKGDVEILKKYDDFANAVNERGKSVQARLIRLEEAVVKGRIKEVREINKNKQSSLMKEINFSENPPTFSNAEFILTENNPTQRFSRAKDTLPENQFNFLMPQNSCVSACWNKQWGACLSCVLTLVCTVSGNSGSSGNTGSSGSNYQACINGCNSLSSLIKRIACKAKCIF